MGVITRNGKRGRFGGRDLGGSDGANGRRRVARAVSVTELGGVAATLATACLEGRRLVARK